MGWEPVTIQGIKSEASKAAYIYKSIEFHKTYGIGYPLKSGEINCLLKDIMKFIHLF